MLTLLWFLAILSLFALIKASPSVERRRQPTWFDLLPCLKPSKKGSGRLQQTAAHRKRKTRR